MPENIPIKLNIRNDINGKLENISEFSAWDYLNDLKKQGSKIFISKNYTPWIEMEKISLMRFPLYNFQYPQKEELEEVLAQKKILLASFVVKPSEQQDANAVLYICSDQNYCLKSLPSSMQRNIKKAKKELYIKQIFYDEFIDKGMLAFKDTRTRVGLNDGTEAHFKDKFLGLKELKTYKIWGAFLGEIVIAYIIANEAECWAELSLYSATDYLNYRPNDYLMFYILNYYLVERKFVFVSYGLSSIQFDSNKDGLHRFKLKIGFNPIPVHRVFIIRKSLFFLKSKTFKIIFRILIKIYKSNRRFKKIEGVLELLS
jgi:uncharacterized protein (UPF0248 family)